MVFMKGDPKTREAARRGGTSGKKHLQTLSKRKLKQLTSKGGKASGEVRRQKKLMRQQRRDARRLKKYEDDIMSFNEEI